MGKPQNDGNLRRRTMCPNGEIPKWFVEEVKSRLGPVSWVQHYPIVGKDAKNDAKLRLLALRRKYPGSSLSAVQTEDDGRAEWRIVGRYSLEQIRALWVKYIASLDEAPQTPDCYVFGAYIPEKGPSRRHSRPTLEYDEHEQLELQIDHDRVSRKQRGFGRYYVPTHKRREPRDARKSWKRYRCSQYHPVTE